MTDRERPPARNKVTLSALRADGGELANLMTGEFYSQAVAEAIVILEAGLKRTRVIEISVETYEIFLIRRPERISQAWCEGCGARVQMVGPGQAAARAGVTWREIARRVESGQVHFIETPAGGLLVCANSLK